jgi:ribosomal subunit interface protein
MNVSIVTNDLELTVSIRAEIINRLKQATERYGKRIRKAEVSLTQQTVESGETNVVCVMKMRINHLRTLIAKTTSSNLSEAISTSARGLREKLERQIHKENKHFGNRAIAFSPQ